MWTEERGVCGRTHVESASSYEHLIAAKSGCNYTVWDSEVMTCLVLHLFCVEKQGSQSDKDTCLVCVRPYGSACHLFQQCRVEYMCTWTGQSTAQRPHTKSK